MSEPTKFRQGDKVLVTRPGFGGIPVGTVIQVDPGRGPVSNQYRVRMNEGYTWFGEAELELVAHADQPKADGATSPSAEYTGGSVSYYKVRVEKPTSGGDPYDAECNDIIEALGMNYAEGNAFKAIWRSCAARNLGLKKAGYKDGLYDAEKVVFFGGRMVEQAKGRG